MDQNIIKCDCGEVYCVSCRTCMEKIDNPSEFIPVYIHLKGYEDKVHKFWFPMYAYNQPFLSMNRNKWEIQFYQRVEKVFGIPFDSQRFKWKGKKIDTIPRRMKDIPETDRANPSQAFKPISKEIPILTVERSQSQNTRIESHVITDDDDGYYKCSKCERKVVTDEECLKRFVPNYRDISIEKAHEIYFDKIKENEKKAQVIVKKYLN